MAGTICLTKKAGRFGRIGVWDCMASHQLTPAIRYDSGTSYAAPRTTHKLAMIMSDLRPLGIVPSASLLKAFLINSARYPLGGDDMKI